MPERKVAASEQRQSHADVKGKALHDEAGRKCTEIIRGDVKDINFGNRIRSYVLQPYTMVKDHRTNKDVGNAASVLDGNIDPFINAYLNWISTGKKEGEEA